MKGEGLSLWGYSGLALFAVHVALLFFPPIPPDIKGSLWSWLTGYIAIALLLVETARNYAALPGWWNGLAPVWRWALGLLALIVTLALGAWLRVAVPWLFERFHREEGLVEPLMLYCYLGAAIVLLGMSRDLGGAERRHWRFVGVFYLMLGLEEIDYFGIFGGIFGRIGGVYAGSLHDLINLAAAGVLSALAWTVIIAVLAIVVLALWVTDYLQPRALWAMISSFDFLWISIGLGFLTAAAVTEARLFGFVMREPTLEETLELCGAIGFFCYALSFAGRRLGRGVVGQPDS